MVDPAKLVESIEHNKILRENITLVLKYTTILPFRYFNNQYLCHYCDKPYLFFNELRNHVLVTHSNITEQEINRTVRHPNYLVRADVSDISCKLCGSNYNTIGKLVEHLKELHSKKYVLIPGMKNSHGILGFDLSNGFKCYVCGKEFQFLKNLSTHMNDHDADFTCDICGKRFVTEHRLIGHVERHCKQNLECLHCNETFKSVARKTDHIHKERNRPNRYNCPECKVTFSQNYNRLKHMVENHNFKKPDNQCQICLKNFAHTSALTAHIKFIHNKEDNKKHLCEICEKSFRNKWLLKRHLNVHTGAKNFECQYCDKKFAKKYTLQVHVKIHLNERPFPCYLCSSAFVQKYSLKKHLSTVHAGVQYLNINSLKLYNSNPN